MPCERSMQRSGLSSAHEANRCRRACHRRCRRGRRRGRRRAQAGNPTGARGCLGARGQIDIVRVLLDATSEIGQRAGRILLAEPDISFIGLWDQPNGRGGRRSGPVTSASGFDVGVSDAPEPSSTLVAQCAVESIPLVLWSDASRIPEGSTAAPIVTGANVGLALAEVLHHHPTADATEADVVIRAWTEPGKPLRRGEAIVFPDPVGTAWARERSPNRFVARRDDQWGGAVVDLDGPAGRRIVGVADNAAHLEALVLAATTLTAAAEGYPNEVVPAASAGEHLLNNLVHVELDFATWRSAS